MLRHHIEQPQSHQHDSDKEERVGFRVPILADVVDHPRESVSDRGALSGHQSTPSKGRLGRDAAKLVSTFRYGLFGTLIRLRAEEIMRRRSVAVRSMGAFN